MAPVRRQVTRLKRLEVPTATARLRNHCRPNQTRDLPRGHLGVTIWRSRSIQSDRERRPESSWWTPRREWRGESVHCSQIPSLAGFPTVARFSSQHSGEGEVMPFASYSRLLRTDVDRVDFPKDPEIQPFRPTVRASPWKPAAASRFWVEATCTGVQCPRSAQLISRLGQ